MASASGSQTEGADNGQDSGDSDDSVSEDDEDYAHDSNDDDVAPNGNGTRRRRWTSMLGVDMKGKGKGRERGHARLSPTSAFFPGGGDLGGRGEHVLVERRSTSAGGAAASGSNANGGSAGGGERRATSALGRWGSSLLDARDAGGSSRRRPGSPAISSRSRAGHRDKSGAGDGKGSPPGAERSPSPPLTMDSIQSTYNPFPLFHVRVQQIPEVALLTGGLLFALIRLYGMSASPNVFPYVPPLPFTSMLAFVLAIPFLALFRRQSHYFKAPFTDERGYRDPQAADDGVTAALILPVLLACAVYWDTYVSGNAGHPPGLEGIGPLVQVWEASGVRIASAPSNKILSAIATPLAAPVLDTSPLESARALFLARHQLVLMTALNSVILVLHLVLAQTLFKIERLPKSNTKRFFGFMAVAYAISTAIYFSFTAWDWSRDGGLPISPLEAAATTLIQQSSFYIVSRLARRGFTLGELNTMTIAGNALCLEFWRLSRARWYFKRGFPVIPPTFRHATPIIAFQSVLIPGAFLSGFLLSPLLVISRHIASKPAHRLKWPTERERHRRLLAAGVFLGLFGIVFFFLGGWAGWILGPASAGGGVTLRRPWLWAVQLTFYGGNGVGPKAGAGGIGDKLVMSRWARWKRIWLVAYWAGTIVVAVGGWQTRLVRARRIRMRMAAGAGGSAVRSDGLAAAATSSGTMVGLPSLGSGERKNGSSGITLGGNSTLSSVVNSVAVQGASELKAGSKVGVELAREEKRVYASLNMRRKFFHALAVAMFVPGIAIDPAFTSLAFSVAFALFTFSEYARYFALYPVGAPLHIFFSEFVDSKDSGPVILSHFYLLTGCAGGLWLEGHGINRYTGVLVLGVGDSMASIVGKLIGRIRWIGTNKTVEGSVAFVVSIALCAWLLRLTGLSETFSMPRYLLAITLSALLEASSNQNDNLIIPIFMWSMVTLLEV